MPLARWAEGESDILETSYNPTELAGGPGAIWQQFVARIPGRLLVFRTIKTPDDFPYGDEYRKVTSIFELTPEGEGTRVRLTSTGYPDSEGGRALAGFFAKGDAATLESLQRRFVEGPSGEPLHLSNIASWGPDMILFLGEFPDGRKWELIQHYSQVSLLLVAVRKINEEPRRIGFELLKTVKEQDVPWEDPIS